MSRLRLLIDAGNTRVKWVLATDGSLGLPAYSAYSDLAELSAALQPGLPVYLASVTRGVQLQVLLDCLNAGRVRLRMLASTPRFGDLQNAYVDPLQLGVDRWMALIGARKRTRETVLVVSAGTALTVDALCETGQHLGGIIVPGMAMMRAALQSGTAMPTLARGEWAAFPRNTEDAVESGILKALAGAIRAQYDQLPGVGAAGPRCYLTGGDAPELLSRVAGAELHPALVLEGIACVANEDLNK